MYPISAWTEFLTQVSNPFPHFTNLEIFRNSCVKEEKAGIPRNAQEGQFCPHHTLIDPIQSMRSAEVTAETIEDASVINCRGHLC